MRNQPAVYPMVNSFKRGTLAFTLIELLVVIGIVGVLLSILVPVVSKARESANRAKCAANLHNWGVAAHLFATEHKGYFPAGMVHGTYCPIPDSIEPWARTKNQMEEKGTSNMQSVYPGTDDEYAQLFGLDLRAWEKYGLKLGSLSYVTSSTGGGFDYNHSSRQEPAGLTSSLVCPSSTSPIYAASYNGLVGNLIRTHYLYVGGYTQERFEYNVLGYHGNLNPKSLIPAVTQFDRFLSDRVLAADDVMFIQYMDPNYFEGPNHWVTNHGFVNVPGGQKPKFQNILYGDGHVAGEGPSHYAAALSMANFSIEHAPGWMYWYFGVKN